MTSPTIPSATAVRIEASSAPGFECVLTHGPSGTTLTTVAPKDNGGTGLSFSPTDLLASALLACALTTMALAASREGIPLGAVSGHVDKHMTPPPRRIGALPVRILMPAGLSAEHRKRMEQAAHECPVRRSLSPDVQVSLVFEYPDA